MPEILDELLTGGDVARRLGVSRARAHQITSSEGFPEPLGRIGQAIVWRAADVDAWACRERQGILEVTNEDGVTFRTIPNKPGYLAVIEPDGRRSSALAWLRGVIIELLPTKGGVLVRTARNEGRIAKNMKGAWSLSDAWKPGEREFHPTRWRDVATAETE